MITSSGAIAPQNPHPHAQDSVTITLTQEELYVLHCGVEKMCDAEDGEFAYIREVAGSLSLPPSVITYQNMKA